MVLLFLWFRKKAWKAVFPPPRPPLTLFLWASGSARVKGLLVLSNIWCYKYSCLGRIPNFLCPLAPFSKKYMRSLHEGSFPASECSLRVMTVSSKTAEGGRKLRLYKSTIAILSQAKTPQAFRPVSSLWHWSTIRDTFDSASMIIHWFPQCFIKPCLKLAEKPFLQPIERME